MKLTFARILPGRKVGKRCRKPTRKLRGRRRCKRFVAVKGAVSADAAKDANRLRFQGRISRSRRLKPGSYRATLVATDAAGNRSKAVTTKFTLVRPKRR